MQRPAPRYVLILAAGKGTRMGSAVQHKVCFTIDGRPVINRAIEIYRASGISSPIIVVGMLAEQVMQTVAREHKGIVYAYQAEQLGTGHATRVGMQALEALAGEADTDLLLVAGDRIVDAQTLQDFYALYYTGGCDLAFISAQRTPESEQGRIILDDTGQVMGVVEMRDIWQRQVYRALRQELDSGILPKREDALTLIQAHMNEAKAQVTFGELWLRLQSGHELSKQEWLALLQDVPGEFVFNRPGSDSVSFLPAAVAAVQTVNVSAYLLKASALRFALAHLSSRNAQHEEYLSDIINVLVQGGYRVRNLEVEDSRRVLGCNNPAELLAIEAYFRSQHQEKEKAPAVNVFRPLSSWLQTFTDWVPGNASGAGNQALAQELEHTYGDNESLLNNRRNAYLDLLEFTRQQSGSCEPVALVRSPGRANILGRHVDHQGGNCNLMAIDREIIMAVRIRDDDVITLHNIEGESFHEHSFSLHELLAELPWDDWTLLVNSPTVTEMVRTARGDWSQYVKAAVLRLQKHFHEQPLRGMDLYVHGNIPVAAGLSSSSALVVAAVEAVIAVNNLAIQPSQLVDLCGEGEWFVGTRGGSADHAAIKYGQRGQVTQVTFFPFGIKKSVAFPSGYHLVLADSRVQARKSQEARSTFNHRVACYRIGLALIKRRFPQYAPLLQHLRDVNTRTLGIPLSWLYRILLALPENCTREELQQWLPPVELAPLLANHTGFNSYPIRGVVLFGLAECERSRLGTELLALGQVELFGTLMCISHDGDRVARFKANGTPVEFQAQTGDDYLRALMEDLDSGEGARAQRARLELQPGAYRCSTAEIDWMVDIARGVPGVLGAQLAGAGLGGCMMVLAPASAIEQLQAELTRLYYVPRGLEPGISVCTPIAGSGVLGQNGGMAPD